MSQSPHVLILVENLPVPFDRRVWMESLALVSAGYRVSVISPMAPDDPVADKRIEGVNVYRYPPPEPTASKLSFLREFAYCYRRTSERVARVWRDDRFDVIHSCNPPDLFWGIARKYKKHGVKFVFDHHDLCPELYLSKFGRRDLFYKGLCWCEKRQFATADGVIATNQSYRDVAVSRGGKRPEDVTVVRSGPLKEKFKHVPPVPELKRGKEHLVVYLGVMGPQDGVDYALRAVRHALDEGLDTAYFVFIGSGDSHADLVALAEQLNLDDHVHFTGRIPDLELKQHLCTADLGLAPDPKNPLNDLSTMNKVVEYMAMGLPVVSFDLKESRYTAGDAAVYIPDDDEKAMGRAIINLLADPARRAEMAKVGVQRVDQGLGWEHSRVELVNFYNRLLAREPVVS